MKKMKVDMSPKAVKARLESMDELWLLSVKLMNSKKAERMEETEYRSTITCSECGFQKQEEMPTDSCVFFYECENCQELLKPKKGDCCVFCSYGSVECPPKRTGTDCC